MPPAIIAAGIATAGAVGSAVIGSKASSKAAAATTQAADTSAQVQRDIYGQNSATLQPYVQAGIPATQQINALLGLTPTQSTGQMNALQPATGYPTGAMGGPYGIDGYVPGQENSIQNWNFAADGFGGWTPPQFQQQQTQQPMGGTVNTPSPQSAFDTYRNSTGYQFRLGQGLNAVNSGWAGRGLLQSGAALKGLNDYGQGMASAEFGNYLNALGNQQSVGLTAGSALAGVGQNYANSLGNIYQNKGENLANSALVSGQNNANLVNSLATIGAGIFGKKAA